MRVDFNFSNKIQIDKQMSKQINKKQIPTDTAEWNLLDRQVQVATGKSSIKLISAYKFDEPSSQSLKLGRDKNWIDATINLTDFSKDYFRQVINKQIALEDLILYAGHVNIHRYSNQPYKIFTFLFCKICLGTAGTPQTPKVQNCDSLIIQPENQDAFQYNFFVKQHWQYQVKYEANFTVSEDKEFKIGDYSCCNCENRTPVIYCATQNLYFCEDCCNDHHKTKLMHSHLLETIDKVNTLQNCKNHNNKFELYCLKCEKYLCSQCIQRGIHAQGTDHVIKPVRYYYSQLNQNIDALPKKSQEKLEVLLYNLTIKRKQIQDNQREVRLQIEKEYKRCIKMLEQETAKKYQMLDSNQLQLTLLKDKIAWNQSFSVFQSSALKPIHFFKSQVIFEEEIKKLKVSDFQSVLSCKPDLVYQGFNAVGTRDSIEKNGSFQKKLELEMSASQSGNKAPSQIRSSAQAKMKNEQQSKNLLSFDPQAELPIKGGIMDELSKCNFAFFQIKNI